MRVLAADLAKHINKKVTLNGWLHKKRAMGGLMFIVLRDRSGLCQVVIENIKEQKKLHGAQIGSILSINGTVIRETRAIGQAEIHNPTIKVDVFIKATPIIEIDKPINHKSENFDTLFDNRFLNVRNPIEQNIFKIQMSISNAIRKYLEKVGFVEIHTPKLLAGATEGGAEVFKLDYFSKQATLAQSPQFYKQMMVGAYERVYEIGPVFRAEPSMTTRHMSEYTSIDAEMGFINSFEDVEDLLSELLNFVVDCVWKEQRKELDSLKAKKPKLTKKIPRISMSKVHELFSKVAGENTIKDKDLSPSEERFICEYSSKNLKSEAIFVTDWPSSDMKFYHCRNEKDPNLAVRSDLLFRGMEIVTGSQREHRYEKLVEQLKTAGGDPANPGFYYYLQAFKYGLPPHGGFGLGLERLTQELIGLSSVKEATLFPRDMQRLTP